MSASTGFRGEPVLCWVQPEWRAQLAVSNDIGVKIYRITSPEETAMSGTRFSQVYFQATRAPVTALAGSIGTGAVYDGISGSVLGAGQADGSVSLLLLGNDDGDNDDGNDQIESRGVVSLYEASGRACRAMAFNALQADLLASGFERAEGQASLRIHDLARGMDVREVLPAGGTSVTSVAWSPEAVEEILVAARGTHASVRLFDLRTRVAGETVLHVQQGEDVVAELQVEFDPYCSDRFMTSDRAGYVRVWDRRWPGQALHELSTGGRQVAYSPRRAGMLAAALGRSVDVFEIEYEADGRQARSQCMAHVADAVGGILTWVPPTASAAVRRREQLVTCAADGALSLAALPAARVVALGPRGGLATSNNWESLLGVAPTSAAEVARLHASTAEVHERPSNIEDILPTMRVRALHGYGSVADTNTRLAHCALWRWVRDADIRRRSGAYTVAYRADISYCGVADLLKLPLRRHMDGLRARGVVLAPVRVRGSRLNAHRALALAFCGWDLYGSVREQHIATLEAAGECAAAAGAAFVYGDLARCLQSLERSGQQDQKLLSFMLRAHLAETQPAAAAAGAAPTDMFSCANLQMIFTFLVTRDWARVLAAMQRQPLATRLAVALRNLDDARLGRYLARATRAALRGGELDGLLITGIGGMGRRILQAYVDRTADVQTAALLVISDPEDIAGDPAEQWIYAYRHLLNMWRMFTTRCLFDIASGNAREMKGLPRMSRVAEEIATRPADVRCIYCNQSLGYDVNVWRAVQMRASAAAMDGGGPDAQNARSGGGGGGGNSGDDLKARMTAGFRHGSHSNITGGGSGASIAGAAVVAVAGSSHGTGPGAAATAQGLKDLQKNQSRLLYTACPKCSQKLPRCVICRMTLGTPVVALTTTAGDGGPEDGSRVRSGDFTQWFSWCQTCGHGGHAGHMQSWFATHDECPIPGCECECEKRY